MKGASSPSQGDPSTSEGDPYPSKVYPGTSEVAAPTLKGYPATSQGEPAPSEGGPYPRKGEPSPRKSRFFWLAILLLALGLRLPLAFAGFPYINYVDEGHVLHPVVALLESGGWDPQWHLYPSLPFYAIAGAVRVWSPIYSVVHDRPLHGDLSEFPPKVYDLVAPAEVLAAGRLVTLAFSLGVVVLTGLLARRVTGSQAAGLFAALAAAVVPALVIRGAIATVDPFTTFFTVAAVCFAEGAVRGSRPWRDSILAGLMIGCALTSKYTGVLVCVPVAFTLLRVAGGWRYKARAIELAALASLVAAVVTMPALVLKSQ
ncbi:MAG TPA: glycosyltransferase family 39 protein, partial [Thermoanaerobaculia bacterium]|nr:glycosyltransferase family 39 protein [Thermoanaerobaculia bacterium]